MIDTNKGTVTLCSSGFCISQNTKPPELTRAIPSLISQVRPTNTGYTHCGCWVDMEPQVYVWAFLCFHGDDLESIRLFPQHQSTTLPAPQPHPMNTELSNPLVHEWYRKLFAQDELSFDWGSIRYCEGNDPIYAPTSVLIEYKHHKE